ncbi:hypothetical protein [Escherichia coli]|uniref:hypothetical protein n=1 Tax=Escherichia coli TaxID=562 RepID=UPI00406375FD
MGENRNYHSQRIHYFRCALALIIFNTKRKNNESGRRLCQKVISEPYEEYGKWWIDVEYISWGVPGKTRLMFESKEQALEVKEGYKFLT